LVGATLVDVNERLREPDVGFGCGGETVKPMTIC